jgi:hypothetical protein
VKHVADLPHKQVLVWLADLLVHVPVQCSQAVLLCVPLVLLPGVLSVTQEHLKALKVYSKQQRMLKTRASQLIKILSLDLMDPLPLKITWHQVLRVVL